MIVNSGYQGDYGPAQPIIVCFNSIDSDGRPASIEGTADVAMVCNGSSALIGDDSELTCDLANITGLNVVQIFSDTGLPNGEYGIVMSVGTVDGNSVAGQVVGSFSINR